MTVDFSEQDILFIYGRSLKQIGKLNELKSSPSNPIANESIDQEIELYSSITSRIEKACPKIAEMKKYKF